MEYGCDFDFSRTFTEQFEELIKEVPLSSLSQVACEDSPYTNLIGYAARCHLTFASKGCEDSYYCSYINDSSAIVDCTGVLSCENSF
jgi:hypothetical protein